MIFILDKYVVAYDASRQVRRSLAAVLQCSEDFITVKWGPDDTGRILPTIDVDLPPHLPPAALDVNDAEAVRAWQESLSDVPDVVEFFKARGVANLHAVVDEHLVLLAKTVDERVRALMRVESSG